MNKKAPTKNTQDTKHKAYPKYKPSGVEWLGDVPEHWEVKRARFMISMNPSKQEINKLNPETEVTFLPMEAVGENGSLRLDTTRPISEVSSGYTFFSEGDVSFAKITPCFENGKGAIMRGLCTGYGFGTTELTVMRPSHLVDTEYLYYLSVSYDFRQNGEAWMYGAGGQKRVPDEFVKEFRIGFPSLLEQQAIAAFLDRETGRIDSLITQKQRLLELLAEQRSALISRAVTRGLNPDVKMKPSGIEWLGDVPEHWETWKISHGFGIIGSGTTPKSDEYENYEGDIAWVTTSELRENIIYQTKKTISLKAFEENSALRLYPKGTLLFAMYGATIGRLGILGINATVNQACCAFASPKAFDVKFVFYWLFMRRPILISLSSGGGQPNLSQDDLRKVQIQIPHLPEQKAIATFLDRETAKIDALSDKVNTIIEMLKEYRTALISSAVTGKIDVRQ